MITKNSTTRPVIMSEGANQTRIAMLCLRFEVWGRFDGNTQGATTCLVATYLMSIADVLVIGTILERSCAMVCWFFRRVRPAREYTLANALSEGDKTT